MTHKSLFFRSAWANYDTAAPGTLRLLPPAERRADIARDSNAMREMFFQEPPSLEEVFDILAVFEGRVNGMTGA